MSAEAAAPAEEKVVVLFRAVGGAPLLKRAKFKIAATSSFGTVEGLLRKMLQSAPGDALFLYVDSAFAPAPDDAIGGLAAAHAVSGKLVINYALTAAFG